LTAGTDRTGEDVSLMMNRRNFLRLGAAAGASAAIPAFSLLPRRQEKQEGSFQEITDEQVKAVEKGLGWLAKNQSQRTGAVGNTCQVAFTGLAGLAFLAGGNTPSRGKYAANVRGALRFMMRCCSKQGYINEGASGSRAMGGSGMHGHGYGLLFLCELYGMCGDIQDEQLGDEPVKDAVNRAVKLCEKSQDPSGGWIYDPNPYGHEGSVTITQVEALRAARNAGISVGKTVIDKGIGYIKKSTAADGTIMYSLGSGRTGSYALTAAGACVYAMFGIYDAPESKRCVKALYEMVVGKRGRQDWHPHYTNLYAGQACFLMKSHEPKLWTEGYPKIRKELLSQQDKGSGCWTNDSYGGAFGTACACLVLQIPFRLLPIFQD
jgi:hypothetical protein